MEVLHLADLQGILRTEEGMPTEQSQIVGEEFKEKKNPLTAEQKAKKKLQRFLSNPETRKGLPRWIVNGRHPQLALRLMADPLFASGCINKKRFTLRVVQHHYRKNSLTTEQGNVQLEERRIQRQRQVSYS